MNNGMKEWLSKPPTCTTFRINRLRTFNIEKLEHLLNVQSLELNTSEIPKIYFLRPDCLIVEQWPNVVKIDTAEKQVIVDSTCAAAVLRGAHVFAPGIMGLPANCQIGDRVDIYGDLDGNCKRGLKVTYNGKKQYVGTGYLKMTRNELFDNNIQPSGIAVQILLTTSRLPIINETLYPKGVILLQNLPSIVCGWVVNAQPNEYILDMCAAPGNKTTHLGEMSNNQAMIIALDKTSHKIKKIEENCKNHGITCVKTYVSDSTKCYSEKCEGIDNGPPFPANSFDKVLLDAPCSGLGQRPQLKNKMTPKMLESYKFVQRKLLNAAVDVLKVGGKLIYSTCTVTEDENERLIAWALKKFTCLKLIPAEPLLGGPGLADCDLNDAERVLVQRFGPTVDELRPVEQIYRDTIGFFIAQFIKV